MASLCNIPNPVIPIVFVPTTKYLMVIYSNKFLWRISINCYRIIHKIVTAFQNRDTSNIQTMCVGVILYFVNGHFHHFSFYSVQNYKNN